MENNGRAVAVGPRPYHIATGSVIGLARQLCGLARNSGLVLWPFSDYCCRRIYREIVLTGLKMISIRKHTALNKNYYQDISMKQHELMHNTYSFVVNYTKQWHSYLHNFALLP